MFLVVYNSLIQAIEGGKMYQGTMTKDEALIAMKAGFKVAHSAFTSEEYLSCEVLKSRYVDPETGIYSQDEMVTITSEDGYNFNAWFFDTSADGLWKHDGKCWLIRK